MGSSVNTYVSETIEAEAAAAKKTQEYNDQLDDISSELDEIPDYGASYSEGHGGSSSSGGGNTQLNGPFINESSTTNNSGSGYASTPSNSSDGAIGIGVGI